MMRADVPQEIVALGPAGVEARRSLRQAAGTAPDVAVLIPCYNEEQTIARVVQDFRKALPEARIYVGDNASTDCTAAAARAAGAIVNYEPLRGKGNVVRRLFADINAEIYVLVDGDDTYDANAAPRLVQHLREEGLDLLNGARTSKNQAAYRFGHRFGNALFTKLVAGIFGKRFEDMLSGYKVCSRRFAKSFPALAQGFEIETEITIHALELRMPVAELQTDYRERPEGSASKLNTFRDGWRILTTIIAFLKKERPLTFFGVICALLSATSLGLVYPLLVTYLETGLVPRLPTAVLACSIMLLAFLCLASGLILDTVTRGRREMKRMFYLSLPVLQASSDDNQPQ